MRTPPSDLPAVVEAALAAGIRLFDTAHAYGDEPGDNERALAAALRGATAQVVTKGGMVRTGTAWMPDGRATAVRRDCLASLDALGGRPIDLYLLHAPDHDVPWATSVRALGKLLDEGLVRSIGVCNVNLAQLDEALSLVPVSAVQVAHSRRDDSALRGGVVRRCEEAGVRVLAHSPLGGPRRVRRDTAVEDLAWLLAQSPVVVPVVGARTPAAVRSAVSALDVPAPVDEAPAVRVREHTELRLLVGVPGAGKSRLAAELQGFQRLNRDERGGSLGGLVLHLDALLAAGAERVVVDNTHVTRASRNRVLEVAARHGVPVTCVWLDTPIAEAQVNAVLRQLDLLGRLPAPEELKALAKQHPGVMLPGPQLRMQRELEVPSLDEGFADLVRVPFVREARPGVPGAFVSAAAARAVGPLPVPTLVFGWQSAPPLPGAVVAVCRHPGGPPTCWCRPPLPGLVLDFCHQHGVDPAQSVLYGASPTDRRLAAAVGARYVGEVPVT
jgi:aryl-alcohol dehydrogenase-like predicted oxidoreductase